MSISETLAIIGPMRDRLSIAIDGPVAVGKTVVGRALAARLRYRFLDTGVMYRAVTWAALKRVIHPSSIEQALVDIALQLRIDIKGHPHEQRVLVDGADVTNRLRSLAVERKVSSVAQIPGVREALVVKQRALARSGSIVMVGRDIGTVVLPDADLKIFLEAPVAERAKRRHNQIQISGGTSELQLVQEDMEERDRVDTHRVHSPLRRASDAIPILTDSLSVEDVVERILDLLNQ